MKPARFLMFVLLASGSPLWSQTPVPGWPVALPGTSGVPIVIDDLDGDGDVEVIAAAWGGFLCVYQGDGTPLPGWPFSPVPLASPGGTPVIADIDGDGAKDLVFSEITSPGFGRRFFALDAAGQVKPGWPIELLPTLSYTDRFLSLADLAGDGIPEIIIPSRSNLGLVHAFHGDGTPVPGWPITLPGIPPTGINSGVGLTGLAVGDFDANGSDEIVVTYGHSISGQMQPALIWIIDGSGNLVAPWTPLLAPAGGLVQTPILQDCNSDGTLDLVLIGNKRVYWVAFDGTELYPYQHYGSGLEWYPASGDLDGDGIPELVVPSDYLRIIDPVTGLHAISDSTEALLYSGVTIGDVDGDGRPEIAAASDNNWLTGAPQANFLHLLDTDLNDLPGWPIILPFVVNLEYGNPTAMADLDGDGDLEILLSYNEQIHAWSVDNPSGAPLHVSWGSLNHDRGSRREMPPGSGSPYPAFLRGDADRNGQVGIGDAIVSLSWLFLGTENSCVAQLDTNGDDVVDLADPVSLLDYLFVSGVAPPPPFPSCTTVVAGALECADRVCPE